MGIKMTTTGTWGNLSVLIFSPKGALTHHLRSRRWYPSLRSGRALFPKHPQDASPEGADNAAAYLCRHCLCGWQKAFALFASSMQTVVRCRDNLPPACENLPPAAFSQRWTMHPPHRPFSFAAPKETKPPLAGGRKEVKNYGDLSSGSKGREPGDRPFCLRGVCLSELQRHLQ